MFRRLRSISALAALAPILAIVTLTSSAHAVDGSGAISLTISPNVRGEAMGGLYSTQSGDYSSRWGNPGLLAFIAQPTLADFNSFN